MTGQHLLLFSHDNLTVAAHLKDGVLWRVFTLDPAAPGLVGSTFSGQVLTRIGKTRSFMVDLGEGRTGFLQLSPSDLEPTFGQSVEVTVTREAETGKQPKLKLNTLLDKGGPPRKLKSAANPLHAYVKNQQIFEVTAQLSGAANALKRYTEDEGLHVAFQTLPRKEDVLKLYPVDEALAELAQKSVASDDGWSLVIEPLEAVTFIDVNAGPANLEAALVNQQAIPVLAEQLRLRNLTGLIVVDFLKMSATGKGNKARAQTLEMLKTELAKDDVQTDVLGFTKAGLVEMIRARTYPPIHWAILGEGVADG